MWMETIVKLNVKNEISHFTVHNVVLFPTEIAWMRQISGITARISLWLIDLGTLSLSDSPKEKSLEVSNPASAAVAICTLSQNNWFNDFCSLFDCVLIHFKFPEPSLHKSEN